MTLMKNFIQHQECPNINGIYYPDETVHLLNINAPSDEVIGSDEEKTGMQS
jgi:hypothetical protein